MRIDDYREQARKQWGRATPFRVGFMVGMADDNVANPYHPKVSGHRLFEQGRSAGQQHRRRAQALLDNMEKKQ